MKSLEIIDKIIRFEVAATLKPIGYNKNINAELNQIKRDLEVLEILEPYILKYGNVMTLDTYLHSFCQDNEIDKLEKWMKEQDD